MSKAIGFTGTRYGMTSYQMDKVKQALTHFKQSAHAEVFIHGDCIGADAEADTIARQLGYTIVISPGHNPGQRAHCEKRGETKVLKAKPNLIRNMDIVAAAHIMLACPHEDTEQLRSGTWATVRFARKIRRLIYIIGPENDWSRL